MSRGAAAAGLGPCSTFPTPVTGLGRPILVCPTPVARTHSQLRALRAAPRASGPNPTCSTLPGMPQRKTKVVMPARRDSGRQVCPQLRLAQARRRAAGPPRAVRARQLPHVRRRAPLLLCGPVTLWSTSRKCARLQLSLGCDAHVSSADFLQDRPGKMAPPLLVLPVTQVHSLHCTGGVVFAAVLLLRLCLRPRCCVSCGIG